VAAVKEGDDSASAIRSLLQLLRQLNFAVPQSFSVARLQTGSGREVCGILDGLADWALERASFRFQQPIHGVEEEDGCVLG
jgi:peptidoglycan hydrolase-like protein with peptidoglycan-binding domain